jgi:hypothetical protein
MGAALAIFSGPFAPLARLGVVAIVLLASAAAGWIKGDQHGTQKLTDYIGRQAVATEKLRAARVEVVTKTEIKYRNRVKVIHEKGDTVIKEVPVLVTQADDSACRVPAGFVRSYNAGLQNQPAGSAAESDRADSGLALSGVAAADAENWKLANLWKERALMWQRFYEDLRKAK